MSDRAGSEAQGGASVGFGKRALARGIDLVALAAGGGVVWLGFAATGSLAAPDWSAPHTLTVPAVLLLVGVLAYDAIGSAFGGATIGKVVEGLRVRDEEGGRCTLRQAADRALWSVVDGVLLPVTYVAVRRSARRQRWGDRQACTVVTVASDDAEAQRAAKVGAAVAFGVFLVMGAVSASVMARNQETAVCDRPEDAALRDACLERAAMAQSTPEICERSATPEGRDACYGHIAPTFGPAWCDKIEARGPRYRCYSTSAREPSVCARIEEPSLQEQCVLHLATATHDARLCGSLKGLRAMCLAATGSQVAPDDACSGQPTPSARDACYLQHGMCDRVQAPPLRDQCYVGSAADGGTDCGNVISLAARAACLAALAAATQNPALCEGVGAAADNPARRSCYAGAFDRTATPALCARFTDPVTARDCKAAAARVARSAAAH